MSETLKRLLQIELSNEKAKNELALIYDFDPYDAFKILDCNLRDELQPFDILKALQNKFGISSFSLKEIDLFVLRYDKVEGQRIKESQFVDIFKPRDPIFAEYFKKKCERKSS